MYFFKTNVKFEQSTYIISHISCSSLLKTIYLFIPIPDVLIIFVCTLQYLVL